MIHSMLSGGADLLSLGSIVLLVAGTLAGVIVGATPGLGGVVLLSIILPFLYGMSIKSGVILMLAAEGGVYFSGSITAILLNTPGAPESAATTFDGYEMTKQGMPARALGISATASTLGGWVGFALLLAVIPAMRSLIGLFQPSDFLMLAILAILLIGQLRASSVTKGILSGLLGLMASYVGYDPITGIQRFTFNTLALYNGFNIAAVALGLFAMSEMFVLYGRRTVVSGAEAASDTTLFSKLPPGARVIDGVFDVLHRWPLVLQSGVLGTLLGAIPGVGAVAATFISYGLAKRTSRRGNMFGTGIPEGIIAPEAAVMAKESGGWIPTVTFGLPGGAGMAVVLSGLTILGVAPGPSMLTAHLDEVFAGAFTIGFASLLGSILGLLMAPYLAKALRAPPYAIVPFIFALGLLGSAASAYSFVMAIVTMAFGLIGLVMKRYRYSPAATMIGFVLGPIIEKNLYLTTHLQGMSAFARPLTDVFAAMVILMIVTPAIVPIWKRLAIRQQAPQESGPPKPTVAQSSGGTSLKISWVETSVDLAWVILGGAYCAIASTFPPDGRLMPFAVGAATLMLSLTHLSGNFVPMMRPFTHGETEAQERGGETDLSQIKAIAWAISLLVAIFLIGALPAIFLFFVIYFGIGARRWVLGPVSAVLMTLLTWGLFGQLMSLELPQGIVTEFVLHWF
ncbi:MAG TPA: tripartite tricarboxylate transporter permease [Xanthobacteraceae bacterium]|jgi:putative tricarboxylic transport membrane protein